MRFETVKKASQVKLEGVVVNFDLTGDTLNSVTIIDESGNILRVINRTYSLYAEVAASPKMTTKHRVFGTLCGLDVDEIFDDAKKADARSNDLNAAGGSTTVESVEVQDNDIIGQSPIVDGIPIADDDIPF